MFANCPQCGKRLQTPVTTWSSSLNCPFCRRELWVGTAELATVYSQFHSTLDAPVANLTRRANLPAYVMELLPREVAFENDVLALGHNGQRLLLAATETNLPERLERTAFVLNSRIAFVIAPASWLWAQLRDQYQGGA